MKNNTSEQITEKDFHRVTENYLHPNAVANECFLLAQKMVEQSKGSKGSGYKKVLIKENGNPINKDNHILKFYDTNQGQRYFNFEKKFWEKELSGRVEWYYEETTLSKGIDVKKLMEWIEKEIALPNFVGRHNALLDLKSKINSLINEGK